MLFNQRERVRERCLILEVVEECPKQSISERDSESVLDMCE